MRSKTIAGAVLLAFTAHAPAKEFICRNGELEVACVKGKCEKSDGFTPSEISLDTKTRALSICTYSMCLEGKANQLLVNKAYVIGRGDNLLSNTGKGTRGSGVVVINLEDKTAAMMAQGFVNPMTCEIRK